MKRPEPIEVDEAEVQRLIDKAEQGQLDAAEQQRLVPLLKTLLWLEHALVSTRISISKLKRLLFGHKTERRKRKKDSDDGEGGASGAPDADSDRSHGSGSNGPSNASASSDSSQARGHGRRAATDYPGAEVVFCPHPALHSGCRCLECTGARVYRSALAVRRRFHGQALVRVIIYELERLRCNSCGAVFVAPMPVQAGDEIYDVALRVNLALAHYQLGLPFKRIEAYQDLLGMALPDARQWELVESVADSLYPVYEALKVLAAGQSLVYQDDTGARLLSLIKENRADPPPERPGMHTTALRFEAPDRICLYFTGRAHAGENLDAILAHRDPALEPIQWMSDALAANTPKQHQDRTLTLNCLVHARRQFVDLGESFPQESARIIDAIAEVYRHEAYCKQEKLDPNQRLAYHRKHTRPVMDELQSWMQQQIDDHCVEPNSALGGAFNYLLTRWTALSGFLEIPGAPIDNNAAEQALKMIVRVRKNSLFYKNEHGAYVGDVITSLIQTCRLNDVNPLAYFSALMQNRSAVFADPSAWLPWNYPQSLDADPPPVNLGDPPPVVSQHHGFGVAVPQ